MVLIVTLLLFLKISASLLAEVQSKLLYDTYLKSKNKERSKVSVISSTDEFLDLFEFTNKKDKITFEKLVKISEDLGVPIGLIGPPDEGGPRKMDYLKILLIPSMIFLSNYGQYILNGLTSNQEIEDVELNFNPKTNKTEIIITYQVNTSSP